MSDDTGDLDLTSAALPTVARRMPVPTYERQAAPPATVHLGVGGFHRAHQAMFHDRLLQAGDRTAGICGVGTLPSDEPMRDALRAQDILYTLVEKHPDGERSARVIGSLSDYLFAPDDPGAVLDVLTRPSTRVVSLTVTEGGYNVDTDTGEFDADDPATMRDVERGNDPRTAFGFVVEALRRRREDGTSPFTVMSCDNLPGNGTIARAAVSSFADLRDDRLGDWVRAEVAFPNSMVDRITPATTDTDRVELRERYGVLDRWPVVCEPFVQWVLEDEFVAGRPAYETVGVQVVTDVEPYELMKLRLLNAGHQALGYIGYLAGHRLVHEAAQDPLVRDFVSAYLTDEASPTLEPVPGIDLADYRRTLLERFANPHVGDTLARLCTDSSDRIPKFVLPVLRDRLRAGGDVRRCATIVAAWARYAEGTDEAGEPIEVVDRMADRLQAAARDRDHPTAFLEIREVFGDLAEDERFVAAYRQAAQNLHEHGTHATLRALADRK